jgi:hypothetical protein
MAGLVQHRGKPFPRPAIVLRLNRPRRKPLSILKAEPEKPEHSTEEAKPHCHLKGLLASKTQNCGQIAVHAFYFPVTELLIQEPSCAAHLKAPRPAGRRKTSPKWRLLSEANDEVVSPIQ